MTLLNHCIVLIVCAVWVLVVECCCVTTELFLSEYFRMFVCENVCCFLICRHHIISTLQHKFRNYFYIIWFVVFCFFFYHVRKFFGGAAAEFWMFIFHTNTHCWLLRFVVEVSCLSCTAFVLLRCFVAHVTFNWFKDSNTASFFFFIFAPNTGQPKYSQSVFYAVCTFTMRFPEPVNIKCLIQMHRWTWWTLCALFDIANTVRIIAHNYGTLRCLFWFYENRSPL